MRKNNAEKEIKSQVLEGTNQNQRKKLKTGSTLKKDRKLYLPNKVKTKLNKKYIFILAMVMLVGILVVLFTNTNIRKGIVTYTKKLGATVTGTSLSETDGATGEVDGETNENARGIEIGDKALVSSATIIGRVTGTGPWDEDDNPGNDSSPDNNIVRSFDQVTWTAELTMEVKSRSRSK